MAFAQPLALWFLLLAIPIALLYLLKQRRRRVQVSTLLFWDQILRDEHAVTSMTKLRKLLSLLLQLLIVTLLALALARPVFSRDLLGARRIVVMLDTSASMATQEEDGQRFEQAKAQAAEVFRGMSIGDSGMLVTVAQAPDIRWPLSDSRKQLLDALESVELTHSSTKFDKAMAVLHNLPPDERETLVYIVTDGAFDPFTFEPPARTRFAYLPVGRAEENMGITSCQLRPLPASPRDFEILFEVTNHTSDNQKVSYEVRVGGLMIDAGELAVPKGGAELKTVRQFSQTGGEVEVAVDFDDAFDVDNHAYAVLPQPRSVPVILVTDGNLFLEAALLTDDEIELVTVSPGELVARVAELPHAIEEYVLIFDRCVPGEMPYTKAIFIHQWPESLGPKILGDMPEPLIADWDREHPINRHLQLMNVRIQQASRVEADETWTTLISAIEDPLVLYRDQGGRKIVLLAFDTVSSDLPLRVAFPILIANAVRHINDSGGDTRWASHPVGELLTYGDLAAIIEQHRAEHTGDAGEASVQFAVVRPGNEPPATDDPTAFSERAFGEDDVLALDRSGIYAVAHANGSSTPLLSASLNHARESDIAPAKDMPVTSVQPLPMIEEGLRLGSEPWLLLATLGVAMLTAEWFLFHRRWSE